MGIYLGILFAVTHLEMLRCNGSPARRILKHAAPIPWADLNNQVISSVRHKE
jgi:hypothetical protein